MGAGGSGVPTLHLNSTKNLAVRAHGGVGVGADRAAGVTPGANKIVGCAKQETLDSCTFSPLFLRLYSLASKAAISLKVNRTRILIYEPSKTDFFFFCGSKTH